MAARLAKHRRYCELNPEIEPELIEHMLAVAAAGGQPSIDGAMYAIRERGGRIENFHRAHFSREIKNKRPDLAAYLRRRRCELDNPPPGEVLP